MQMSLWFVVINKHNVWVANTHSWRLPPRWKQLQLSGYYKIIVNGSHGYDDVN